MVRIILIVILYAGLLPANALNKKDSLHLYPIISINSENFSDLKFLDEFIGDKKIVFLGESAHGINDFHVLKFRLIKYLHEFHDFDVVAFESGVANIGYTEILKDSLTGMEMLAHTLMGYWRVPVNCRMMTYIRDNKMNIAGLDPFTKAIFFKKEQYKELGINSKLAEKLFRLDSMYVYGYSLEKSRRYRDFLNEETVKDFSDLDSLAAYLISEYTQVVNGFGTSKNDKERILVRGVLSNIRILHNSNDVESEFYWGSNGMRDRRMAKNIEYLKDTLYPNKKIIVLAHNWHIQKTTEVVKVKTKNWVNSGHSIGNYLSPQFKEQSFVVGISATSGTYTSGYNPPEKIELKKRSLENAINDFSSKAAFVPASELQSLKYIVYSTPSLYYTRKIEKLFDGMIFVNDVEGIRIIRKADNFHCE